MARVVGMLFLLLLLVVLVPAALPSPDERISCVRAAVRLRPCIDYIVRRAIIPSERCCRGVRVIAHRVRTINDRQSLCRCIQRTLSGMFYNGNRIAKLPRRCRVPVRFPRVSPRTDCSRII